MVETTIARHSQLPGTGNPNSIASLLAGSHTVKIWYADPAHVRLSVPVTLSETDLIRNGSQAWLWQSASNSVTKFELPAKASGTAAPTSGPSTVPLTPSRPLSPDLRGRAEHHGQRAAQRDRRGRPPTLVLAPKASGSLVGAVSIAVDATENVPLRVQVFAKARGQPGVPGGLRLRLVRRPRGG